MTVKGSNKIKEAFIDLLKKQKYSEISISDIAHEAQITRRTFYLHYENKLQLFEEIMGDFIEFYLNPFLYEQGDELKLAIKRRNMIQTIRMHHEVVQSIFDEDCPAVAKKQIEVILNNQIDEHEAKGFFLFHFDNIHAQHYFVSTVSGNLLDLIQFILNTMDLTFDEQFIEVCKVCDVISYFYNTDIFKELKKNA